MAQLEFNSGNRGNIVLYKIKALRNSVVYAKELLKGYLSDLNNLVSWNSYTKRKNTQESMSAIQHLKKMLSEFHKIYPNKLTAISFLINSRPTMGRPV